MVIDIVDRLRGPTGGVVADQHMFSAARDAADEIERLRYVLNGVRGAIDTGRNEPLMIWRDQIDIALSTEP